MVRAFIFSVCIGSFIVWLNLLCFLDTSEAESIPPLLINATGPYDCWGIVMKAAKSIIKTLRGCTKDVKANSTSMKDMSEKLGCVMRCVMHRITLVDDDYLVSDKTLSGFIHRFFPSEEMVSYLIKNIRTECLQGNATKLDPSDDKCSSYGKFAVCMQSDLGDVLNNPEYCIPKDKEKEFAMG